MSWDKDTKWEAEWWGGCNNTFGEEMKQLLYSDRMGLKTFHDGKSPYNFIVSGKILDIGGGPCSLLLKCPDVKGKVVDPCDYPVWIGDRYKMAGIEYEKIKGENIKEIGYDEVWIYNVLQHTENPEKVIKNALEAGKIVRLFEWIDTGTSDGHPHELTEKKLNEWLNGKGKVEELQGQNTCYGKCYYGIFKGKNYV